MAQLLKYEEAYLPDDFYSTKSAMWLLDTETGKIRTSKKKQIHAEIWGGSAWDNPHRGYYHDGYGIVVCHGHIDDDLMRKLAKKFPRAMYYRQGW